METNLRSKFSMIAWGTLLPFIMTVIIVIVSLTAHSYSSYQTLQTLGTIALIIGIISQLLCITGSFTMLPDLKKRGIPTSGAICIGIAFSISFVMSILSKGVVVPAVETDSTAVGIIVLILSLSSFILLLVGISKLSGYIRGIAVSRTGLWIIVGSIVLMVILAIIINSKLSSYYDSYYYGEPSGIKTLRTLAIIDVVAMLVGYIVYICGWFSAIGGAGDIDDDESYTAVVEQGEQQTSMPTATAAEIMGYQASLRLLNDEQLNYILANPSSYAPAYVSEATKMLAKRQSWERINTMTDEQLLNMVSKGLPEFSNEECDVASMVLFTRRSPLFMAQLQGLSTNDLNRMSNNPLSYYEGYVAAARDILASRK